MAWRLRWESKLGRYLQDFLANRDNWLTKGLPTYFASVVSPVYESTPVHTFISLNKAQSNATTCGAFNAREALHRQRERDGSTCGVVLREMASCSGRLCESPGLDIDWKPTPRRGRLRDYIRKGERRRGLGGLRSRAYCSL